MTEPRNHRTMEGQGESSIAPLFQSGAITRIVRGSDYSPASEFFARVRQTMMGDNPKLVLVNVDVHTKSGQILSMCSRDIVQTKF